MATSEDMDRAISEGLQAITHLFNAMPPLASRTPGAAGAGLASSLICGVIADGHHVHPTAMRAAFRAKGPDELMLVTDAMPTVGTDRSEEHTSELQSLMRISYAVFCLKKKNKL